MGSQARWHIAMVAVLALLVIGMFAGDLYSDTLRERTGMEKCIKKVLVTRAQNPFRALDSRVTQGEGAGLIKSADPVMDGYSPVETLSQYAIQGDPLMGVRKDTGEVIVNGRYFSELNRVDATRIEAGRQREIGRYLTVSSSSVPLRDVVLFLLESQIVMTYWHVESELCLAAETDAPDIYKASFLGIHKYYTNEYNEERLDFTITICKKAGVIMLLGGP